jgi:hypothetical protein
MQDDVCAGLGARREVPQPGVEREEAEEAEGCAGLGDEDCEGGDRGYAAGADEGCGGELAVVAGGADQGEEVLRKGGDGGGFCLEVGEDVEGVVKCGEEGGEAAGGCEESVWEVSMGLCFFWLENS